jgi:hypothetical protein
MAKRRKKGASARDRAEIASGKASARDIQEAGIIRRRSKGKKKKTKKHKVS